MKRMFFLMLLNSVFSFGQCPDYDKLETGGTYLYRTRNYIPFEIKYKDSIYHDDIFYPYDIKLIEKYSTPILSEAKTYIINRAGEDFYKNVELESMEVNYPETIKADYDNLELYKLENYDVTFWNKYTYKKDNYKYAFCLLFDKKGNMISENKFPDVTKNPNFENYINPCDALTLVKSDARFHDKKIDFIELAYLDEINSFCWLVKEKKFPTKLGPFDYDLDSYFVNANTNKIEKIETSSVSGIACGIAGKAPKKEKKKKKKK